jgi:hypothetical protein
MMQQVTLAELVEFLRKQSKSASFCTLKARTVPDMPKRGNPYYGKIWKVSTVNGIINWRYENAVNNQRVREKKEADFEALPRTWGTRLEGQPFVEHNGKLYLELKVQSCVEYYYETLDGLRLDATHVHSFMKKKESSGRQGLEKEVILRDYACDNIRELLAYNEEFVVNG